MAEAENQPERKKGKTETDEVHSDTERARKDGKDDIFRHKHTKKKERGFQIAKTVKGRRVLK